MGHSRRVVDGGGSICCQRQVWTLGGRAFAVDAVARLVPLSRPHIVVCVDARPEWTQQLVSFLAATPGGKGLILSVRAAVVFSSSAHEAQ